MHRIRRFSLLFLSIFTTCVPPVFAEQISIQPMKTYMVMGGGYRANSIGDIQSNWNTAHSEAFRKCIDDRGDDYGVCSKAQINSAAPAPGNPGFINGEPMVYSLTGTWHTDNKHHGGHNTETNDGYGIGVDLDWSCPTDFTRQMSGPAGNQTASCVMVREESLSCGNPLDVFSGEKTEYDVDYRSANGMLTVERQYLNQYSGWVNAVPRAIHAAPGEVVSTEDLFPNCMYGAVQNLQRLKATYEEPLADEHYTAKFCGNIFNTGTTAKFYTWLNGKSYTFTSDGNVFLPDGDFKGPLRIESLVDPQVANADWQMTHPDGATSFFDADGKVLKTVFPRGGYVNYHYDGHQLVSKSDHTGRSILFFYNDKQRLESVRLPDDGLILYDYEENANEQDTKYWLIAKITYPDGATKEFRYNEPEHVIGNGSEVRLTGKLDSYGNRTGTYKYLGNKAVSTEGYAGANKVNVPLRGTYYADVENSQGTMHRIAFTAPDAGGKRKPSWVRQPGVNGGRSALKYYAYNTDGQLTQERDFDNTKTQYAYDPESKLEIARVEGIPASQWGTYTGEGVSLPLGASKTSTRWNADINQPTAIAGPNKLTTIVYHGLPDPFNNNTVANCKTGGADAPAPLVCRVVEQATTDATGTSGFNATLDTTTVARHYLYTYNAFGNVLTEKRSPDFNNVLTITYYQETTATHHVGDVRSIRNALGHTVTYLEYDANGNPTKIDDPNGVRIALTYDPRGRVTSRSVDGKTTSFAYDFNGQLTSITANGITVTREYDGAGRLKAVIDELLNRVEFDYDLEGNLLSRRIVNASAVELFSSQYQYDGLSRLQKSVQESGDDVDFEHDLVGNLTKITDAKANATSQTFDSHDRLSRVTDAKGGATDYTYNSLHQITSVTDPRRLTTTYEYNGFGELVRLSSPDSGVTEYQYDNAGNRTEKKDARGIVTRYQYDALNRLVAIIYPDNSQENIQYFYDDVSDSNKGLGRLTGLSDQTGSIGYRYDAHGNISEEKRIIEGQEYITSYEYTQGLLTKVTYPSGRIVTYAYNVNGQVNKVSTQKDHNASFVVVINDVHYLPFGPMKSITFGNGLTRSMTYDSDYRLTGISSAAMASTYDYDLVSNISAITDALNPANDQNFAYDALSRLTDAEGAYGSIGFGYDAVGNRIQRQWENGTDSLSEDYVYANDSNQLLEIQRTENGVSGSRSFEYSEAGNTISDLADERDLELSYNHQNRLESVVKDGQNIAVYLHNALGQRVIKVSTSPASNQHFHYSLSGLLIAESMVSGETLRETIYLNGIPVAVLVDSIPGQ